MADTGCTAAHHFFVADVAQDESAGTVMVIALCTACGKFLSETFQVAPGVKTKQKEIPHVPIS